jgi:hypothetical protein
LKVSLMIEQRENQLVLSFPTPEAARAFAQFLTTLTDLREPDNSVPPSGQSPESASQPSTPDSPAPEPSQSRRVLLTDERLAELSAARESGSTRHQRIVRAQTMLRDGTLPFKQLSTAPSASGQASPRERAQREGGFADGAAPVEPKAPQLGRPKADAVGAHPEVERRKRSRLRPASSPKL